MAENIVLDVDPADLHDLELEDDQQGSELEGSVLGWFILRCFTVLFVLLGSLALVTIVYRRGRGSWKEVIFFTLIQIIWQVLAWYTKHIDRHFVHSAQCPTVDCKLKWNIFVFVENFFHGAAVYSGVALVGRLEGLQGVLLWILGIMSAAAPLLFSVIILLLDLNMTAEKRYEDTTEIGIGIGKTIWFNIIPAGLLVCWFLGQCLNGFTRLRSSSSRETASRLIALFLIIFHIVHFSGIVVYVVAKNSSVQTQIELSSPLDWLLEGGYLLAALAIPGAWILGLLLPRRGEHADPTEVNLKLAKENKRKNIIHRNTKKPEVVATPPTTPFRFKPEITSSPSAFSQETSNTVVSPSDGQKSKRSSYVEAVSSGSLNVQTLDPAPTKSKSVDPLWLPSSKPLSV